MATSSLSTRTRRERGRKRWRRLKRGAGRRRGDARRRSAEQDEAEIAREDMAMTSIRTTAMTTRTTEETAEAEAVNVVRTPPKTGTDRGPDGDMIAVHLLPGPTQDPLRHRLEDRHETAAGQGLARLHGDDVTPTLVHLAEPHLDGQKTTDTTRETAAMHLGTATGRPTKGMENTIGADKTTAGLPSMGPGHEGMHTSTSEGHRRRHQTQGYRRKREPGHGKRPLHVLPRCSRAQPTSLRRERRGSPSSKRRMR